MGGRAASVVMLKLTLPFLISLEGIDCRPTSVTERALCPGGCASDGFAHLAVTVPVASNLIDNGSLPSPARTPEAERVGPLSVKLGLVPALKCTLAAGASVNTAPMSAATARL